MKQPISALLTLVIALLIIISVFQTTAYAQQANNITNQVYRNSILHKIDSLIECKYVIIDKASKYAAEFRQWYKGNKYDTVTNAKSFAKKVTEDLQVITRDKHISLRTIESSDIGEKSESGLHNSIRFARLGTKENLGFYKLEWINEKIGYLDLRRFYSISMAKEMINAAMKFLSNASAIIIDVRENGGGAGDYLSSYFLKYPTQLSSCYYRENNYTEETWTSRDIEGEPRIDIPLFIIIGKNTFSASEAFAYDLQALKRAILIGEPSKGGAHSYDSFKLDNQFEIQISTARSISPITGGNWEAVGVIPDIQVPPAKALDTAIVLADKAAKEFAAIKDARLKTAIDEMQNYFNNAEKLIRAGKIAEGNKSLDSLFSVASKFNLLSEFFINVLSYNYYISKDEPILLAITLKWTELYPKSSNAFENLALTYYDYGKKDLAIKSYKKVLELNPDNKNAKEKLKELESNK